MRSISSGTEEENRSDLGAFNVLPYEMLKHLFTFFHRGELHQVSRINKTFHHECQQEIEYRKEKYKNNVFYALGKPIPVTHTEGLSGQYAFEPTRATRKNISDSEIIQSFKPSLNSILLFKTEQDALSYCKCLPSDEKTIPGGPIYQPVVFRVLYLSEISVVDMQKADFEIDPDNAFMINLIDPPKTPLLTLHYLVTEQIHVVPVAARLILDQYNEKLLQASCFENPTYPQTTRPTCQLF